MRDSRGVVYLPPPRRLRVHASHFDLHSPVADGGLRLFQTDEFEFVEEYLLQTTKIALYPLVKSLVPYDPRIISYW